MDDLKAIKEKARKWDYFTNPHGNYTDKISTLKARIATLVEENERLKKWCEEFNALDIAKENTKLLGEIGKDLSSLTDDRKDETDGILSIATLGTSSVVKGVVKSIKKAGEDLDD